MCIKSSIVPLHVTIYTCICFCLLSISVPVSVVSGSFTSSSVYECCNLQCKWVLCLTRVKHFMALCTKNCHGDFFLYCSYNIHISPIFLLYNYTFSSYILLYLKHISSYIPIGSFHIK